MKKLSTIIVVLLITLATNASAQSCGRPLQNDRDQNAIKTFLLYSADGRGVLSIIMRMHELAVWAAITDISLNQRQALNNEYHALKLEIYRLGTVGSPGMSVHAR